MQHSAWKAASAAAILAPASLVSAPDPGASAKRCPDRLAQGPGEWASETLTPLGRPRAPPTAARGGSSGDPAAKWQRPGSLRPRHHFLWARSPWHVTCHRPGAPGPAATIFPDGTSQQALYTAQGQFLGYFRVVLLRHPAEPGGDAAPAAPPAPEPVAVKAEPEQRPIRTRRATGKRRIILRTRRVTRRNQRTRRATRRRRSTPRTRGVTTRRAGRRRTSPRTRGDPSQGLTRAGSRRKRTRKK